MAEVPSTMKSLVSPKKGPPSNLEVRTVPTPAITSPTQVLIKVEACGLMTGDMQLAQGKLSVFHKAEFPMPIGCEGSGTVVAVGNGVETLRIGDEVYGLNVEKPMFRGPIPAFASEYSVCEERLLQVKPRDVSFEAASTYAGSVTTAYQTIRRGLELSGEKSLEGKTVFVPGALSATGSIAIQVAKNAFGASKIISTVSTPKMELVEQYLPGMVDQLIDYKTQKVRDLVPRDSVDFVINTQWTSLDDCLAGLDRKKGILTSLTGIPSKATAMEIIGEDRFPWWFGIILNLGQLYYKWKLWGTNIKHEMVSGDPSKRPDLEKAGELVAEGKVNLPVLRTVKLGDIDAVRKECVKVAESKGGIGKLVIKVNE